MGKFTFRLPDIGEGIAEAEIVAWHVKVGDRIEEDGRIADVMTDKATVEMESPVTGVVLEVAGAEGDMIAIGSALVVIEVEGEVEADQHAVVERIEAENPAAEDADRVEASTFTKPSPKPVRAEPVEAPSFSSGVQKKGGPSTSSGRTGEGDEITKVLASPAVRARAKDLGIDLASQPEKTAACLVEWTTQGQVKIRSLCIGLDDLKLQELIKKNVTFDTFFAKATMNAKAGLITGVICGYRVEDIENHLTQQVRYLDKLVDELAKGRKMGKILRVE